jgi:hypothetical protein
MHMLLSCEPWTSVQIPYADLNFVP